MTDFQRCLRAATASPCSEKGAALQLTQRHLDLIRTAQLALQYATTQHDGADERGSALAAWQSAAESLAIALVSSLETIEEAAHD
jgi:hypothetical protein